MATRTDANAKQLNPMSIYSDEKITISDEPESSISSPTEGGTLPTYSDSGVSGITSRKDTSTASQPDHEPDVDPISRKPIMTDMDKEVVVTDNASSTVNRSVSTLQQTQSYREYNFYYTGSLTHLIICDPNQRALYFAEVSPFAKGMPDVQLRDLDTGFDNLMQKGPGLSNNEAKYVPVMATADAIPNSKHAKLGLGDPLTPEKATWITMRNVHDDPSAKIGQYEMMLTAGGKQMKFDWIVGASTGDSSKSRRDSNSKEAFRLLSEHGLVAVFKNASMVSMKKRGALRLYEIPDLDNFLVIIFLGAAWICEKQRRSKVKKAFLLGG